MNGDAQSQISFQKSCNGNTAFTLHGSLFDLVLTWAGSKLDLVEAGAAPQKPIPLFVGLFGHGYPDKSEIVPVDFETFSAYMRALK